MCQALNFPHIDLYNPQSSVMTKVSVIMNEETKAHRELK